MKEYIVKRVFLAVVTIFVISAITFFAMNLRFSKHCCTYLCMKKHERLRSNAPKPFALYVKFGEVYASPSSFTRACAAARRAIGTRNGEQET